MVHLSAVHDREGDWSECERAVTQTRSPSVSLLHMQLHSLSRGQYMSRYCQTDGPDHAPVHLWTPSPTHTHTHGSERNMSFSNAFTCALFALVNVNISTIFTPASILPGWMCSATDPDASTIEMTWIFFFFPLLKRTNPIWIYGGWGRHHHCREVLWCSFFPKISSLEDLTLSLVLLDA